MEQGVKLAFTGLGTGLLFLFLGLVYTYTTTLELGARTDLLTAEAEALREKVTDLNMLIEEMNTRQATKQASKERSKAASTNSSKKVLPGLKGSDGILGVGKDGENVVGKASFELAQADKKTKSERYSDRIRTSLEAYSVDSTLDQRTIEEALVIIEAWADDRRYYKDSVQTGDLSKEEARSETRYGLSEVQEQLHLLFGEEHYQALDETIGFLSRLQGSKSEAKP